jgi:hypothetical protein
MYTDSYEFMPCRLVHCPFLNSQKSDVSYIDTHTQISHTYKTQGYMEKYMQRGENYR